ncbi:MAG: hypothetical protein LC734_11635 [Acidobacteria bacterium]|nr:hypothetical protein [Acidobacteriota bacterium]
MLELGDRSAEIHRETGRAIGEANVDYLIGVRGYAGELVEGSLETGLAKAEFASDSAEAGDRLSELIRPGDVVLIKGSRGVRTEQVLEKLLQRFEIRKGKHENAAGQ